MKKKRNTFFCQQQQQQLNFKWVFSSAKRLSFYLTPYVKCNNQQSDSQLKTLYTWHFAIWDINYVVN